MENLNCIENSEKPVMTLSSATWLKAKRWQKISETCGWWKTASFASVFLAGGILCWNPKMPTSLLGVTLINATVATIVKKVSDSVADEAAVAWTLEEEERCYESDETPDDETLERHAIAYVKQKFFEAEILRDKDQWLFALCRVGVVHCFLLEDSAYTPILTHGDRLGIINKLRHLDVLTEEEHEMSRTWVNSLKGNVPDEGVPWAFVGMLRDAILGYSSDPLNRPTDTNFQSYCHQMAMVTGLRLTSEYPDLSGDDLLAVINWLNEQDYLAEDDVLRLNNFCGACFKAA